MHSAARSRACADSSTIRHHQVRKKRKMLSGAARSVGFFVPLIFHLSFPTTTFSAAECELERALEQALAAAV